MALPPDKKSEYGELRQRLSKLGSKFGENVLDATNAWSKQVTREQLQGLPETALANARQAALQAGQEDYLINLEFPSLSPVLNYCDNRELREEVYTANCTRASEQGPHAGQWDNTALIVETLELRSELAQLLGFDNYAELSLATKMADIPDSVMALPATVGRAIPAAGRGGMARTAGVCPAGQWACPRWKPGISATTAKNCARAATRCRRRIYVPTCR